MHRHRKRVAATALLALAIAGLSFAGTATAKLTGLYTQFQNCEFTNTEVKKCIYSVTEGGKVILGNKEVPIENDVVLQGGYGKPDAEGISEFYPSTNGVTLAKVPQNVPGGLLGVVPESKQSWLVKRLIKFFFENSLTGLNSTLELAKPASEIRISEKHLAEEIGLALELPLKIHLENPFLGSKCYIGSSSSPVKWQLTSGTTSPPSPNSPISGSGGEGEFFEGGRILSLENVELVDNAWSAPAVSGCGGILAFLVNPIVSSQLGTTSAGHNTAILDNTVNVASRAAVNKNNEENP